jgi:glutamate-1-semialdehyde aminotransferase
MEAANRTFISSTFWTERVGPAAALAALQTMEEEDAPARIHDIGRRVVDGWRAAATACGLNIDVAGLPALSNFSVQGRDPGTVKAYLAQSLLTRGYLGANAIYSSIAHDDAVLNAYFEVFGEILTEVAERSDDELVELLPHGPSWTGFGRLT